MGSLFDHDAVTAEARAADPAGLSRLFGTDEGLLPLWIAEPYLPLAPGVVAAVRERAEADWYGYEIRPRRIVEAFWAWATERHGWAQDGLTTSVSPSVGTSIGVLLEQITAPDNGVILQPPVFTDFKPLIVSAGRRLIKNPLNLTSTGYRMDLEGLEAAAADSRTTALILCNPHNPVGRVWTRDELAAVAAICQRQGVFVIADEIHADLALANHAFTPFAAVAAESGVRWAATHGPIKTFGLAGVCDTLLITDDEEAADLFRARSSQLHLTRNNVFALTATEAAYTTGGPWVDDLMELAAANFALLADDLPPGIKLVEPEGTYLAWLDFRDLGLDVPSLVAWLTAAGLALSPGHWFGREGAGFARMTIAAPTSQIEDAIGRLAAAVGR
ncbi:MAG: MalY/PatB family protein [Acidimicrobiia bacterium]